RFAMAGPTPVSSLLHSATMVGAGSILVWKLTPLLNGWQLDFIYWTVILTALISSLSAITCRDAKEMLAYSTISNLGLLFLCAILSREFFIPMFTAHAFFKCGAFLYVGLKSQGLSTTKFTDLAKQPLQLSDSISLFILAISLSSVSPLGVGLFKQTLSTNSDLVFLISFLSAIYGYRFLRELYSKPSFEIDLSIQSLVVVTLAILALVYPLSFGEINFNLLKSLMIFLLAILTHELLTKRISYDPAYQIEKFVLWIIRVITGIFKSIVHVFDVSLNMLIGSLQDTAKILGFAYSNLIYVRFEVVFAILLVLSLTIVYLGG
ncbi:MAG: hypothetical protein NZO16_04200, partial [Deltaproteobacteria bacterium]|nr:hypothetical protein [Deltaproteobacteria bacterium]